jgi:ABC transport system ATP-binding/permease protein
MWKLTIEDDEGKQTGLPLAHEEYDLGRSEANSIRLTDRNVSRQHATLSKNGSGWVIRDLDSYNGTYVNGVRVNGEQHLRHGDLVQLGDYRIELIDEALTSAVTSPAPLPGRPPGSQPLHTRPNRLVMVVGPTPGAEFPLEVERFTIGRSEDATISINHSSVSRLHAELISLGNGRYEVVDKQSANGVRINGVELKRGLLEAGDALELGDVRLRFVGAGKIFRAGPDSTSPSPATSGTYESVAPSVRPQPRPTGALGSGPGKLMGILLAVGVILVILVFALTRSGPREAPPPQTVTSAIKEDVDGDQRTLKTAQESLHAGDVEGAHKKLQEISETAPARESDLFKDIEEQWANGMFADVERAVKSEDKLRLLNVIASTASVPAALRTKAADMIATLNAESPPPPRFDGEGSQPFPGSGFPSTLSHPSPGSPAPSKSNETATSPARNLDASTFPAQKRALEPRVWSGKATTDEIKWLRAICGQLGDKACRDRANALLQQRQSP